MDLWKPPEKRIEVANTHDSFDASALGAFVESPLKGRGTEEEEELNCEEGVIEIQVNQEGAQQLIVRVRTHGQSFTFLNDVDLVQYWMEETPRQNHALGTGTATVTGTSGDTTYSACQGGTTIATPSGHKGHAASIGVGVTEARMDAHRIELKDNSFTANPGDNSTPGILARMFVSANRCVNDAFHVTNPFERIWEQAEIERTLHGTNESLGSSNNTTVYDDCAGGTFGGFVDQWSVSTFRHLRSSTRPAYQVGVFTEAAAQGTIESWLNYATNPVVDFSSIPQATPNLVLSGVGASCWTLKGGVYYRHGEQALVTGVYTWQYMVPGWGPTAPWTNGEQFIFRFPAGTMFPTCTPV
jgi:hypothetical protein